MKILSVLAVIASPIIAMPAAADPFAVHGAVTVLFDRLPAVEVVADMFAACGSGPVSNPNIGYCATGNVIYVSEGFAARPQASYEMAHVLGHAIQVRHGVADVALREIRNRRDEEDALRGMVTRQVECVAGVLMASADLPKADLTQLFATEPFTDAHWGRRPIDVGPRVSIGMASRMAWYVRGFETRNFAACSVGEMSADLIVQALR